MSLKKFFILSLFALINPLEPELKDELEEITLTVKDTYYPFSSRRSTAIFYTYSYVWKTDFLDEEKKQIFKASTLLNNTKEYKINCGFWKTKIDDIPNIFCIFDESLPEGTYYTNFNGITVTYKDKYKIKFEQETAIKHTKYDSNFLDLYSAEQTINIDEKKSLYDLKFKIEAYYNEQLVITVPNNYIFLDCKKQKNELICPVTKDKFIENLESANTSLTGLRNLYYVDYTHKIISDYLPMISEINILYKNVVKEDVYVGITKCLTNYTELMTYVVYETNVTNIKRVKASLTLPAKPN